MQNKKWLVALVILAACIGVAFWQQAKLRRASARAEKLDEFCVATRDAVRQDRLAFESNELAKQEAAYGRFYEGTAIYHNSSSFLMCVESIPELPVGCWLNKDWVCLARIAKELEDKFPAPRRR